VTNSVVLESCSFFCHVQSPYNVHRQLPEFEALAWTLPHDPDESYRAYLDE